MRTRTPRSGAEAGIARGVANRLHGGLGEEQLVEARVGPQRDHAMARFFGERTADQRVAPGIRRQRVPLPPLRLRRARDRARAARSMPMSSPSLCAIDRLAEQIRDADDARIARDLGEERLHGGEPIAQRFERRGDRGRATRCAGRTSPPPPSCTRAKRSPRFSSRAASWSAALPVAEAESASTSTSSSSAAERNACWKSRSRARNGRSAEIIALGSALTPRWSPRTSRAPPWRRAPAPTTSAGRRSTNATQRAAAPPTLASKPCAAWWSFWASFLPPIARPRQGANRRAARF